MGRAILDRIELIKDFEFSLEVLDLLCGDYVGEGNSRIVFDCPIYKGHVIKITKEAGCWDNITEHQFHGAVILQPDVLKWIAPCGWISGGGRLMLQKKAEPITSKNKHRIPDKVPSWLTDMKHDNFGFIGSQFVCVDYAFSASIAMSNFPATSKRMHKFVSHIKGEKP